jgi:hypothetical protein
MLSFGRIGIISSCRPFPAYRSSFLNRTDAGINNRYFNTIGHDPSMPHDSALRLLQVALHNLQGRSITIAAFCQTWRAQRALLTDLPPRYGQVLEDLLSRLESGSLFSEESCSFSQEDLQASLAMWLDKAQQVLAAPK